MSEEKGRRSEGEQEGFERRCPWCLKPVIPEEDEHGLLCPNCKNHIEKKTGSVTVKVLRPEDVVHPSLQVGDEEEVVSASELGVDDELEVVSVEEAANRCPLIIERWEWRISQFTDSQGRQREYVSMECVDKENRRFIWNTSAWQPCRKLRVAEKEGRKRILVNRITYDMQGGRPVNIRIR